VNKGGIVSDRNGIGRRDLLTGGLAGIAGAAAGYAYGVRHGEPAPAPRPDKQIQAVVLPQYPWEIEIKGGYGVWFRTATGATTITLLALDQGQCKCSDRKECIQHDMKLIAFDTLVKVDGTTTYNPTMEDGAMTWLLGRNTRFLKGMPGKGITEGNRTKWDNLIDPYAPAIPNEGAQWDDQVWLPERETARSNATDYASADFVLTDGSLEILKPDNPQARVGRWKFKIQGNEKKKALTDALQLSGSADDLIGIETQVGADKKYIYLRPVRDGHKLKLSIRHKVILDETPLSPGDKLHHFARLYDFVDGKKCDDIEPPTYEKRQTGNFTPGELCPPLPLG
jgi:hypothetical protein